MVRKQSATKRGTSTKKTKARIIGPGKASLKNNADEVVSNVDVFNDTKGLKLKKVLSTVLLVFLIGFVIYALLPFMNAFLGAIIVYFLCRPLYRGFVKKGISRAWSAGFILIIVLLFITVPMFFGAKMLITEVSSLNLNDETVNSLIGSVEHIMPNVDVVSFVQEQMSAVGEWIKNEALSMISNVADFIINWLLFFFVLYYLLFHSNQISERSKFLLPFSEKNRRKLFSEFKKITNSTVVATGAIGVIQGILLGLSFWIFGIPNPVLWGFISMIFAMLPVIGITFIWIPAVAYLAFINHSYGAAIGLTIFGLITTNIDYLFLRPWIQKKIGKLHPLTTLLGIFMGLPIFGILGLIIGPLLLSIVITMTKMYLEEHITS